jgi:hypothetical protein
MKHFILWIFVGLFCFMLYACGSQKSTVMKVEVSSPGPRYYGETGWHAFGIPSKEAKRKIFKIDDNSPSAYLYKVSQDIAVFLSNKTDVGLGSYDASSLALFGDATYVSKPIQQENGSYIVGYLSNKSVKDVHAFFKSSDLDNPEGFVKYSSALSEEVAAYLEMMFADRINEEVQLYVKSLADFYKQCTDENLEVVMIYFP